MDKDPYAIREEVGGYRSFATYGTDPRLWHNLTVSLSEFVFTPSSGPFQIELFEKYVTMRLQCPSCVKAPASCAHTRFISTIESKINALKLVEIARRIGREYSGKSFNSPHTGHRAKIRTRPYTCIPPICPFPPHIPLRRRSDRRHTRSTHSSPPHSRSLRPLALFHRLRPTPPW